MKLTCDEATAICNKSQYKEASLWEKIKLKVHLFLCNKCHWYSKQNTMLSQIYKIHSKLKISKSTHLNTVEKAIMEKRLHSKLR